MTMWAEWRDLSLDERRAAIKPLCEAGRSDLEIANAMGVPKGTVAGFLARNPDLRDLKNARAAALPGVSEKLENQRARRELIVELWSHSWTSTEIGEHLGEPSGRIRSVLKRARRVGDARAAQKTTAGRPVRSTAPKRWPASLPPSRPAAKASMIVPARQSGLDEAMDRIASEIADHHVGGTDRASWQWTGMWAFAKTKLAEASTIIGNEIAGAINGDAIPGGVTGTAAVPAEGEAARCGVAASPAPDTDVHRAGAGYQTPRRGNSGDTGGTSEEPPCPHGGGATMDLSEIPSPQPAPAPASSWKEMSPDEKMAAVSLWRSRRYSAARIAQLLGAPSKNSICGVMSRIADKEHGVNRPKRGRRSAPAQIARGAPAAAAPAAAPAATTAQVLRVVPAAPVVKPMPVIAARPVPVAPVPVALPPKRPKPVVAISAPRLPGFALPGSVDIAPKVKRLCRRDFDLETLDAIYAAYRAGEPVAVIAGQFGCDEEFPAELARRRRAERRAAEAGRQVAGGRA